ncbi:MAG: hypothetical protein WCK98_05720 [bacterium]
MLKFIARIKVHSRWKIAIKTLPFVIFIIFSKFISHYLGYEFLTLNSLFTAVISANIFLVGFLISGVLVDYKESEKLPGDLSASIETMADEALIIYENKKAVEAKNFLIKLLEFNILIIDWFYKKERTEAIRLKLTSFNQDFLAFENLTQANFIVRLKQEQNLIRKMLKRIHTIRETTFLGTGYAIVEIITTTLSFGLVFVKIDPFYESIFFVAFISFILIYMIFFIKDLDNPFGYTNEDNMVEEISLKPILDSKKRLEVYLENLD